MLSLLRAAFRAVAKVLLDEGEHRCEVSVLGEDIGESSVSESIDGRNRPFGEGERSSSMSEIEKRLVFAAVPVGRGEPERLRGGPFGALRPGTRFPYSSPLLLTCEFSGFVAPRPKLPKNGDG